MRKGVLQSQGNRAPFENLNARAWEYLLLTFLFLTITPSFGQSDTSKLIYSLSGKVGYYYIWTERSSLQQFTRDYPWSVQLDFGVIKNTREAWNYCNCYTENGVSLGYINFSNPGKLGRAITMTGYIEPFIITGKPVQLSVRAGGGLAVLNKVYDHAADREAIFFGSKMSFILGLSFNISWQIAKNWKLVTAAQLNHISNGGLKEPNEGMNSPGVNFGLQYTFNPQQLERRVREPFTHKTTSLVVHGFGGVQTAFASPQGPEQSRPMIGANIGVIRRLGRIVGLGIGGEYYFSPINEVLQQRSGKAIQNSVGGVSIQSYLFLGKVLLGQQFAWYVTPNTGFDVGVYQRYFFEYKVKRNWYAGITLKAHGYLSDYIAFSTGYFFQI